MSKRVKLILGSGSPRRKDILSSMGIEFDIVIPTIDEISDKKDPLLVCEEIAEKKFLYISKKKECHGSLVITSDTIVCIDDQIFGKPSSKEDALETLQCLSGREHQVITSLCVGFQDGSDYCVRSSVTEVSFLPLSRSSINHYLNFNSYHDKAGSYAIQDPNCYFVSSIKGSMSNVIGLPIELLEVLLREVFRRKLGSDDWKKFI